MTFLVSAPRSRKLGDLTYLDLVNRRATVVQRKLRRGGLRSFQPATTATLLALWELQQPNCVFFDIGANIGLYSTLCKHVFPEAEVYAFEPVPDTINVATSIAEANAAAINFKKLALSDESGSATLYLSTVSDASNSLVAGFRQSVGTIQVRKNTLDRFVRNNEAVPTVVKIDVEQHEREVLVGAVKTLRRHKPVLILEILPGQDGETRSAILEILDPLGYQVVALPPPGVASELSETRDHLCYPGRIPRRLYRRIAAWHQALDQCGPPEPDPEDFDDDLDEDDLND